MAKVKIQGNASGTGVLTVTAPNTSTDRTITLPDATGTLLNSDGDGSSLTGVADATKLPLAGGTLTGELTVTQSSNSEAIDVVTNATTVNGLRVNASDLTTGKGAYFYSNASGTETRQLVRIDNDHANATGTTCLYVGNDSTGLAADFHGNIRSRDGILFGTDTAAANTLDDYEEGTHTVTANTGGGSITLDSTNNKFTYTKIGRQVTIVGRLDVSAISSPTGELSFSLPFVVADLAGQNSSTAGCQFVWYGTSGDAGLYVSWADDSESVLYMRIGTGTQPAQAANLARVSTEYRISFSYMTD